MNNTFVGTGRLAYDPELRFTNNGKAICRLRVAFSNSRKNRNTGEYEYTDPLWVDITLWEQMAQNAAELLRKGDELVAAGSLELEKFEMTKGDNAGQVRESWVLNGAEVAPSIRRKNPFTRSDGRGDTQPRNNGRPAAAARTPDPATASRAKLDNPFGDDPPF
jgi:single-strand DNA-binding protein